MENIEDAEKSNAFSVASADELPLLQLLTDSVMKTEKQIKRIV